MQNSSQTHRAHLINVPAKWGRIDLIYERDMTAAFGMHFHELMDWYWSDRCRLTERKNPDVSDRPARDVDAASMRTVKITRAATHIKVQTCRLISPRSTSEYSGASATGDASPGMTSC